MVSFKVPTSKLGKQIIRSNCQKKQMKPPAENMDILETLFGQHQRFTRQKIQKETLLFVIDIPATN